MDIVMVPDELISMQLRETGEQFSWMVFARDGVAILVIGRPVIEGNTAHDILLAAYAGTIGERTYEGREKLWKETIGAGHCDSKGAITDIVDCLGQKETPGRLIPSIAETLKKVLTDRK